MTLRGVRATGTSTVTSALHGHAARRRALPRRVPRARHAASSSAAGRRHDRSSSTFVHRRRRPGRRQGGRRRCASEGSTADRPRRRRAAPALRAAAAVEGLPAGQRRRGTRCSCTRTTGTPSTTSTCGSGTAVTALDRGAHEVLTRRRRAARLRQAAARHRLAPRRLARARRRPRRRPLPAPPRRQRPDQGRLSPRAPGW